MPLGHTSKQESALSAQFVDKLMQIAGKYPRDQQKVAQLLGVGRSYVNRVINGKKKPGKTFELLVELLHKEIFSTKFEDRLTPDAKRLLNEYCAKPKVDEAQFVSKLILKIGEDKAKEISSDLANQIADENRSKMFHAAVDVDSNPIEKPKSATVRKGAQSGRGKDSK